MILSMSEDDHFCRHCVDIHGCNSLYISVSARRHNILKKLSEADNTLVQLLYTHDGDSRNKESCLSLPLLVSPRQDEEQTAPFELAARCLHLDPEEIDFPPELRRIYSSGGHSGQLSVINLNGQSPVVSRHLYWLCF